MKRFIFLLVALMPVLVFAQKAKIVLQQPLTISVRSMKMPVKRLLIFHLKTQEMFL